MATISPVALDRTLVLDEPRVPLRHLARSYARSLLSADLIAVLSIAAIASVLGVANLGGAPAYQDDEGIYTAQAIAVQHGGLAPYTYWYDHPPFGWIQLAILGWPLVALGAGDGSAVSAMRAVIAVYFVANAVLVYLIARRLRLALPFAALASGVFVFSPLSLELGRQVYLDTVAMPWLLLAFWLALSPKQGLWHHAGAGVGFAIAVLTKLTSSILGPALLVAIVDRPGWRGRAFSIVGFLSVGALVLLLFPVMALLRGELLSGEGHVSLEDGLLYQFASRAGSGYLWEPESGRADLFGGWLEIDGFLIIAGLIAAVLCAASRRTRWILVAIGSLAIPIVGSQGYLPAMYIIAAIPFLCLAIAAAADLVWRVGMRLARRHMPGARLSAPLLLTAVLVGVLVPVPYEQWVGRDAALLTQDRNRDYREALAWVQSSLSTDDTVVVPFAMWQDVRDSGWRDEWSVIALEKVDLDTDFAAQHPRGWRDIDWIVDGPSVEPTIRYLGLAEVERAYRSSDVVAEFGEWRIRRVEG